MLSITPIWTVFATRGPGDPPAWAQSIVSFFAFGVWLLAVNGTIGTWAFDGNWPRMGSIILILATTLIFPLLGRVLARFFGS